MSSKEKVYFLRARLLEEGEVFKDDHNLYHIFKKMRYEVLAAMSYSPDHPVLNQLKGLFPVLFLGRMTSSMRLELIKIVGVSRVNEIKNIKKKCPEKVE